MVETIFKSFVFDLTFKNVASGYPVCHLSIYLFKMVNRIVDGFSKFVSTTIFCQNCLLYSVLLLVQLFFFKIIAFFFATTMASSNLANSSSLYFRTINYFTDLSILLYLSLLLLSLRSLLIFSELLLLVPPANSVKAPNNLLSKVLQSLSQ